MRICRKGRSANDNTTADIVANDQLLKADYYKPLIVGYHNGAADQACPTSPTSRTR